jgi:hypothetical protein
MAHERHLRVISEEICGDHRIVQLENGRLLRLSLKLHWITPAGSPTEEIMVICTGPQRDLFQILWRPKPLVN